MQMTLLAAIWASASPLLNAAVNGAPAEASSPSFVEPPTLELALAGIVTLVIYALVKRPPRHAPTAEAQPEAIGEVVATTKGEEPARGAA